MYYNWLYSKSPTNFLKCNSSTVSHCEVETIMQLLLLSHVSRVQLCATPEMAAHQAPPVPGILQARVLEWVAIAFSRNYHIST